MVTSCSAYGCTNRFHKEKNISFHRFPKNPSIRKKWILAMRRENFIPGSAAKLCSEHFCPDDYVVNFGNKSLKSGAVPSIFNFPTHLAKKPVKLRSQKLTNAVKQDIPVCESIPSTSKEVVNTCQDISRIREVQCSIDIVQESVSDNADVIIESTSSETKSLLGKRKRSVPAYMGDIDSGDIENPKKFKLMWQIANKTIAKQKQTIKNLQNKVQRSNRKIQTLCDRISHLENAKKITPECYSIVQVCL